MNATKYSTFFFSKYFSLCYTVILRTLSLYLSILIQSCLRSSKKAPISNVADCNQSILPISIIVIHFINDFDLLFCFHLPLLVIISFFLFSFFLYTNILLFSFQADMLYKIVKYVQLFFFSTLVYSFFPCIYFDTNTPSTVSFYLFTSLSMFRNS